MFVSDLIKTNSDPWSANEYVNLTGYVSRNNSCSYHAVLYSTINGIKTTYLYDRNGNIVKEVYSNGGFRMYKYGVLDLPLEIADYDQSSKQINLTRFIYGLGGQRIGKIGRLVDMSDSKNLDINNDGNVNANDAVLFVNSLFGLDSATEYRFAELIKLIDQWKSGKM